MLFHRLFVMFHFVLVVCILYWCVSVCTPPPPISVNAEHCEFTTRRFDSKQRIVNLQCSALTKMGVVVVNLNSVTWVKYVTVALNLLGSSLTISDALQI